MPLPGMPFDIPGTARAYEIGYDMTWSLIALDDSGALGIAIASRFFAVGALCPYGRGGAGAVSTQALVNPLYGPRAIDAMAGGAEPAAIVGDLIARDPGAASRQVHMIDARGRIAAHTGASCIDWCGHIAGSGWSVAGNMLAGPEVIERTAATYVEQRDRPLAERLIAAMKAGEAAGGDKRGKQGAALRIWTTEEYPAIDIRVDDHIDPLQELSRLHAICLERFQPFIECLPTRANPAGITDRTLIDAHVDAFHRSRATRPI